MAIALLNHALALMHRTFHGEIAGLIALRPIMAIGAAALLWMPACQAVPGEKPLTIVVTFPPGGGTDLLARKIGAALQEQTGQSVLIENRPGASGNIGARHVAEAAGDGKTLLMVNSSFAINPAVYARLDFNPEKDFKAILNVGTIASVLVVPTESVFGSLPLMLQSASQSAPLPFASCGNGTPQHMAGEMLALASKTPWQHIPYKGCAPAATAVAAGQVAAGWVTASSAAPLLEAGRLRALATTAARRIEQLPLVPTLAEHGWGGLVVEQWHGLLAPAATSDAVVERLHRQLQEVLHKPEIRQALQAQGYSLVTQSPAQFSAEIQMDLKRYARLARELKLKVD